MKIATSLVLTALLATSSFAAGSRPRLQSPIESIARELLGNFAAGQFAAMTKDFNKNLRPLVTPAILAEVKGNIDAKAGQFLSVKEARESRQNGFRVVELIARFTKHPVSVVVLFDALDGIESVYLNPILPAQPDPALEATSREMLANFVAGRFEDAAKPLHPDMRLKLTPDEMRKISTNVTQIFGTFQSVKEARQREERGYKIIDLVLAYTNGPVAFRASFDPQGRVCAFQVAPFYEN